MRGAIAHDPSRLPRLLAAHLSGASTTTASTSDTDKSVPHFTSATLPPCGKPPKIATEWRLLYYTPFPRPVLQVSCRPWPVPVGSSAHVRGATAGVVRRGAPPVGPPPLQVAGMHDWCWLEAQIGADGEDTGPLDDECRRHERLPRPQRPRQHHHGCQGGLRWPQ